MKTDLTEIKNVYEKYIGMEESIMKWNSNKQVAEIMKDLWLAVKHSLEHKIEVPKKGAK